MGKRSLIFASAAAALLGLVMMARHGQVPVSEPALTSTALTAASPFALPSHSSAPVQATVAALSSFPSDPKLEADIHQAQQDLVRAIQEEKVSVADLNHRANAPGSLFNEKQFLAGLPPKTAQAFRELHAQLRTLRDKELAQDGKSPDFFQQPAAQAASNDVIQHALTLERLPQSEDVKNFVATVSSHPKVSDSDIQTVAQLCDSHFPCIEKAAYTWIKNNHYLSSSQLELIEQYKNGG